jgi:hypothetical protein
MNLQAVRAACFPLVSLPSNLNLTSLVVILEARTFAEVCGLFRALNKANSG